MNFFHSDKIYLRLWWSFVFTGILLDTQDLFSAGFEYVKPEGLGVSKILSPGSFKKSVPEVVKSQTVANKPGEKGFAASIYTSHLKSVAEGNQSLPGVKPLKPKVTLQSHPAVPELKFKQNLVSENGANSLTIPELPTLKSTEVNSAATGIGSAENRSQQQKSASSFTKASNKAGSSSLSPAFFDAVKMTEPLDGYVNKLKQTYEGVAQVVPELLTTYALDFLENKSGKERTNWRGQPTGIIDKYDPGALANQSYRWADPSKPENDLGNLYQGLKKLDKLYRSENYQFAQQGNKNPLMIEPLQAYVSVLQNEFKNVPEVILKTYVTEVFKEKNAENAIRTTKGQEVAQEKMLQEIGKDPGWSDNPSVSQELYAVVKALNTLNKKYNQGELLLGDVNSSSTSQASNNRNATVDQNSQIDLGRLKHESVQSLPLQEVQATPAQKLLEITSSRTNTSQETKTIFDNVSDIETPVPDLTQFLNNFNAKGKLGLEPNFLSKTFAGATSVIVPGQVDITAPGQKSVKYIQNIKTQYRFQQNPEQAYINLSKDIILLTDVVDKLNKNQPVEKATLNGLVVNPQNRVQVKAQLEALLKNAELVQNQMNKDIIIQKVRDLCDRFLPEQQSVPYEQAWKNYNEYITSILAQIDSLPDVGQEGTISNLLSKQYRDPMTNGFSGGIDTQIEAIFETIKSKIVSLDRKPNEKSQDYIKRLEKEIQSAEDRASQLFKQGGNQAQELFLQRKLLSQIELKLQEVNNESVYKKSLQVIVDNIAQNIFTLNFKTEPGENSQNNNTTLQSKDCVKLVLTELLQGDIHIPQEQNSKKFIELTTDQKNIIREFLTEYTQASSGLEFNSEKFSEDFRELKDQYNTKYNNKDSQTQFAIIIDESLSVIKKLQKLVTKQRNIETLAGTINQQLMNRVKVNLFSAISWINRRIEQLKHETGQLDPYKEQKEFNEHFKYQQEDPSSLSIMSGITTREDLIELYQDMLVGLRKKSSTYTLYDQFNQAFSKLWQGKVGSSLASTGKATLQIPGATAETTGLLMNYITQSFADTKITIPAEVQSAIAVLVVSVAAKALTNIQNNNNLSDEEKKRAKGQLMEAMMADALNIVVAHQTGADLDVVANGNMEAIATSAGFNSMINRLTPVEDNQSYIYNPDVLKSKNYTSNIDRFNRDYNNMFVNHGSSSNRSVVPYGDSGGYQ